MNRDIIFEDIQEIYDRDIEWEQFKGKTILVTGATGMLASYVVYMLIFLNEEKNYSIRIIAMIRSVEKLNRRFGDFCERDYFEIRTDPVTEYINISGGVDYIIHAASLASPQYYGVCPVEVISPNALGTYYLLQLAVEKKSQGFLLFSTGDVYGKVNGVQYIRETDIGVIDPLNIHSCYNESKRMAETMCYAFFHQYGVPARILRIWHTYAPTMDIENDPRVFASFVKNIVNGQDIEIKSDGTGKRTFCYVADAIAALFTVLTIGKDGEAYNVCNTEQFVSIRQLAETLAKLGKDKTVRVSWKERENDENYVENTTIGDVPPDNRKLKSLGWETKYDIERGFDRVITYLEAENEENDYEMKEQVRT